VGDRRVWVETDGLRKLRERPRQIVLVLQGHPQVQVGFGGIRLELNHLPKMRQGFLCSTLLDLTHAQRLVSLCTVGSELHGCPKVLLRFSVLTLTRQHQAPVQMRLGIF